MDKVKHSLQNPVVKICAISIMALLLLIPLAMVKGQVTERSLLLFVILCVIMFLTRNMQLEPAEREV